MQETSILLVRNNNYKSSNMKLYLFIHLFMVGALLQGFGSLIGAGMQDVNNQRTIRAQAKENEKNREYNLQLAKMQNEWNLQQWERENEYNNPLNQMARLKAAGLNPNLVYGNGAGQSTAASSPSLTSGAPSSPVDMSLMVQRPTVGQIMNQALQNRILQAQVDNTEAQTRKTLADADISETEAKYKEAEKLLGIELGNQNLRKNAQEISNLYVDWQMKVNQNEGMIYDVFMKKIEHAFKEREMEAIVKNLENQTKLSSNEVEYAIKSLSLRLAGLQAETDLKVYDASMRALLEDGPIKNLLAGLRYLRDSIF